MSEIPHDQITKIYEKFEVLGKQVTKVDTVVARFDSAFEKLTEVSQTVSKILAVQENRLEVQERMGTRLQTSIEARRREVDEKLEVIDNRIEKNETDLKQHVGGVRKELFAHHAEMKKRLDRIEKWIWMVCGGAITIGAIIGFVLKFIT